MDHHDECLELADAELSSQIRHWRHRNSPAVVIALQQSLTLVRTSWATDVGKRRAIHQAIQALRQAGGSRAALRQIEQHMEEAA